jgi:hypothetical protein
VVVALCGAGVDAGRVDRHVDRRRCEVGIVELEDAGERGEPAADFRHHHVPDREVDARVRPVEVPLVFIVVASDDQGLIPSRVVD